MATPIEEYPLIHLFVVTMITQKFIPGTFYYVGDIKGYQGGHWEEVSREPITGEVVSLNIDRGIEQQDVSLNADVGTFTLVVKDQITESWGDADSRFVPNLELQISSAYASPDGGVQGGGRNLGDVLFTGRVSNCTTTYELDDDGTRWMLQTITGTDRVDDLANITVDQLISWPDDSDTAIYLTPGKEAWTDRITRLQKIASSPEIADPTHGELWSTELIYSL